MVTSQEHGTYLSSIKKVHKHEKFIQIVLQFKGGKKVQNQKRCREKKVQNNQSKERNYKNKSKKDQLTIKDEKQNFYILHNICLPTPLRISNHK